MDVEDYFLLFVAIWALGTSLLSKSVDVFLTLFLVGFLIAIIFISLYLGKEEKKRIRILIAILLALFVLGILARIRESVIKP